jgi:integrase
MKRNPGERRVEDRWHRPPRRGEQVPWPADESGPGAWCVNPQHAQPGTQVTTVRHGSGLRWMARWTDHAGETRAKSFQRKADAENHITGVSAAITTGTYADPRRASVTLVTVAEQWLAAKRTRIGEKTAAGYRGLLDVVVLPKWGEHKLSDIDHAGIQQWVSWLASDPAARHRPPKPAEDDDDATEPTGLSPARVIQAFQVVDQVLSYAVRTKYLAVNPADHVELPRKAPAERFALTHAEVRELAEAAGGLGTMVYVLAYAGMRFGECAALRVDEFDGQRKRLRLSRSVTNVAHIGQVEGPTKTHRERSVPVPAFVAERLTAAVQGRSAGERLFPAEDGGPMKLDYFRWRFDKAAAKAGLTGVTPKTLRHTAGSLAIASGHSVIVAQKLLGHRSATTTMDVYAHMLPDDFDGLAAAMDKAAREVR